MIPLVRRAGVVLVALFMVLAMAIALPGASPTLTPAAQAHGRHDYSYRYCYYDHGYWHCENDGHDWWWYQGREKCHRHDRWYCYEPKGHGRDEHGHDGHGGY